MGSIILSPIFIYIIYNIYQSFQIKSLTNPNKIKLSLLIIALFTDNIAAFFLANPVYNFENLYYCSHFATFSLIIFSFVIPSNELNLFLEFFAFLKKIKAFFTSNKKKSQVYQEMISLNLTENQIVPKESFDQISIYPTERKARQEIKESDKNTNICLFTFAVMCFCLVFMHLDLFARLKRVLSLMKTPNVIDFLNYPCLFSFVYILLGAYNKNVFIDRRKKIQQGLL